MRFRHPDGTTVHLAYCTNVHAAEDLDGVLAQLPTTPSRCAARLGTGPPRHRSVAGPGRRHRTLAADPAALRRCRPNSTARGLEVVTLNGFPYQGFGASASSTASTGPTGPSPARLDHTPDLRPRPHRAAPRRRRPRHRLHAAARLAHRLGRPERRRTARRALATLAGRLDALEELTGRRIRVGLEPEPGCTVETTDAIGAHRRRRRRPATGSASAWTPAISPSSSRSPAAALRAPRRRRAAGRQAPALRALARRTTRPTDGARAALADFAEPRFLHQTRTAARRRQAADTDDLADALAAAGCRRPAPWRSHFHVPLHAAARRR